MKIKNIIVGLMIYGNKIPNQVTKNKHKRFLCDMYLISYNSQNCLNEHKPYYNNNKRAKIILPELYNNKL